jgi:hypothetical protein
MTGPVSPTTISTAATSMISRCWIMWKVRSSSARPSSGETSAMPMKTSPPRKASWRASGTGRPSLDRWSTRIA